MSISDNDARKLLDGEASARGEQVLWWGRPTPGRLALRALPASIFGIPFTAFAVFWMWGAAGGLSNGRGPGLLFPLFGLPFVAVGLGLLLSPLFVLATARRTLYAVTTGGILVVKAGRTRKVERHALPGDDTLRRSERANGAGDLVVGRHLTTDSRGRSLTRDVTFVGIPAVASVERLVADAARGAREHQPPPAPFPTSPRPAFGPSPSYRAGEPRRVPGLLILVVGVLIGFTIAVAAVRTGRITIEREPRPERPPALPAATPPPAPSSAATSVPGSDRTCDTGDGAACAREARAAYERMGSADRARGASLASRGCDLGSAAACGYLAWILDGNGGVDLTNHAAALRAAERGCTLGSGDACRTAGFLLAYGKPGVRPDRARAEPFLEEACGDGHHPRACAALGGLLADRGERARAETVLSGCCAWGDGGCCTQRDRLTGGR